MSEQVEMNELPLCDLCQQAEAHYDSKMLGRSSWAYMCEPCYAAYGIGRLGTGYGQRLVLRDKGETTK